MIIRFVQASDERQLKKLILGYLKETYAKGGDFPPTLENAQAFFDHAVEGAGRGDPCLVAVEGPDGGGDLAAKTIVGFIGTQGLHFPGMQTRDRTIRSWGTYVSPPYRTTHVAIKLFMVMGRVAKNAGYTRVVSSTKDATYATRVINRIAGRGSKTFQEAGALLAWQLAAPLVGDDENADSHNMPADVLAASPVE